MELNGFEIAVIGMACRFPGARDVDQFWRNLRDGVESISFFTDAEMIAAGADPKSLTNPNLVKAGGALPDIDLFDASFFGYSPREAELIDPQQRFFLECAWEALESAGYDPLYVEETCGVFAGVGVNGYMFNIYSTQSLVNTTDGMQIAIANDKDYVATRVSYKLNLKGPSVNVQSACSTSLLATHLACQNLLSGACDIALAGGVTINIREKTGYIYREGGILSPDGHTRAFDAGAQGVVGGSGAGVVVLKRLEDALASGDSIRAVIKGSAANNDGSLKVGFTAPSIDGQAAAISAALDVAEVTPETISYVEAHGTGTRIGDPIEIAALTQAYRERTSESGFCALGAVKTNIGHLDTAAGVAGLIKTVLALQHKEIPPSLHYQKPNPQIDFDSTPFFVNRELAQWETNDHPRRAGLSSFGIGGTNVHMILEEAPAALSAGIFKPFQLLVLSAKTEAALAAKTADLAEYLKQHSELNLADAAYTLQAGRTPFSHRKVVVCGDREEAIRTLEGTKQSWTDVANLNEPSVVFMFPGQGGQHVNMARELYETESFFRDTVDDCCALLGFDLRSILYPEDAEEAAADRLKQTLVTQPALFVIEYALAKLLGRWGVHPPAMIGHSIGEYVAACLAGVFTLEEALQLIATRARLMQELPGGLMLSVPLPEEEILPLLRDDSLSLAAVNGPSLCVVSGSSEKVSALSRVLAIRGVDCKTLHTSHAFHSAMMDPILDSFRAELKKINFNAPQIPYISNVTGDWITEEEATDPDYWLAHLRRTVRFNDGLEALFKHQHQLFIEVGPGKALSTLALRHPAKPAKLLSIASLRGVQETQSDVFCLLRAVGQLWLRGVKVNWPQFHDAAQRRRVPLPTYPFERQRFWIDLQPFAAQTPEPSGKLDIDDWFYTPVWKQSVLPSASSVANNWLLFVDDSGLGAQIATQLPGRVITVRQGTAFAKLSDTEYAIDPGRPEDYESLLADIHPVPEKLVHLWSVTQGASSLERILDNSFYSLLFLAQALGQHLLNADLTDRFDMLVVSNSLHKVIGDERLVPAKATLLGPCRVIPQEYPNVTCRSIDVTDNCAQLLSELKASVADKVVAYRNGRRWVQTFERVRLDDKEPAPRLRKNGVYLITGGLGGVGLEIAEYLARTVQARLVLLSRTSKEVARIEKLKSLGAEVLVLTADVANEDGLTAALVEARRAFGAINGVVHAAGIPPKSIMQRETRETAGQVLSPKVHGTELLSTLLRDDKLDFFLLCSSMRAITGGLGAAAYCAANSYLDAFAQAGESAPLTITVDWDGWNGVGMDLISVSEDDLGMSPAEGVEAFRRILSDPLPQVIVSTYSLQAVLDQHSSLNHPALIEEYTANRKTAMLHPRPELENNYAAPQNQIEQTLANIWSDLLGVERIGRDDNFFDLGGDSVVSIQIIVRAKQAGLQLTAKQVFEHQTIAGLASVVADNNVSVTEAEQDLVTGPVSLTPIQHWFFEQDRQNPNHFNQSMLLEVRQKADFGLLVNVVRELARHHDALRFRFKREDSRWQQVALDMEAEAICEEIDLSHLEPSEQRIAIETDAARAQASLDLSHGPIMRVALFRLGSDQPDRLLIVIHHLVVDVISWRILLEDLASAYEQLERGEAIELPAKTTSFKEWSSRLEAYAQSDELSAFHEDTTQISPMPVDYAQGVNTEASSRTIDVALDEAETTALLRALPTYQARFDEALLASLTQTFQEWTGGPLLVDIEGHGREPIFPDVDLSRTVGWFTTIYPVVIDLANEADAIEYARSQLRRIRHGGLDYGVQRYLSANAKLEHQKPEISFLYLGKVDQGQTNAGPYAPATESFGPVSDPREKRTHLLDLVGRIINGRFEMSLTYSENVHRKETVENIARRFLELLRAIATPEAVSMPQFNWTRQHVAEIRSALSRVPEATEYGVEDFYPLAPAQQGILFHALFAPNSGAYCQQFDYRIKGSLNVAAFKRAWQAVIERHQTFRTAFVWEGLAEPVQVVFRRAELPIKEFDLKGLEPAAQHGELNRLLVEDRNAGLALSRPPLLRCALIDVADDEHHFVWTCHHLLLDGWSADMINRELFAFYEAFSNGRSLELEMPRSYREYLAWLQQQDLGEAETFWRRMLKDFNTPTSIMAKLDVTSLPREKTGYSEQLLYLPAATTTSLLSLGRQHRLTMNTIVMGAWALLLSRHSGQQDVLFGVVTSGRPPDLDGVESMVGLFVNTLPMRIRVPRSDSISAWLEEVQRRQLEVQKYEYSSLAEVQQWSGVARSEQLFESIFAFENAPAMSNTREKGSLEIQLAAAFEKTSYPLTIMAVVDTQLILRVLYDDLRIDNANVKRLLRHFESLLENMALGFDRPVSALNIVNAFETEELVDDFNADLELC
ncbi:MAG TPA: SDR family NAD(P)-dependent oxidoreductase [Pyrinomonadaceae bacterium]|nr:SDR family NAD(P)-dependent oxidoreductase [Pyrinomonadaceae bacterium]